MRLQRRLTEVSEESRQHAAADSEARAQLAGAQLRLLELRTELEDSARAFAADLQQASRAEPSATGLPGGPRWAAPCGRARSHELCAGAPASVA